MTVGRWSEMTTELSKSKCKTTKIRILATNCQITRTKINPLEIWSFSSGLRLATVFFKTSPPPLIKKHYLHTAEWSIHNVNQAERTPHWEGRQPLSLHEAPGFGDCSWRYGREAQVRRRLQVEISSLSSPAHQSEPDARSTGQTLHSQLNYAPAKLVKKIFNRGTSLCSPKSDLFPTNCSVFAQQANQTVCTFASQLKIEIITWMSWKKKVHTKLLQVCIWQQCDGTALGKVGSFFICSAVAHPDILASAPPLPEHFHGNGLAWHGVWSVCSWEFVIFVLHTFHVFNSPLCKDTRSIWPEVVSGRSTGPVRRQINPFYPLSFLVICATAGHRSSANTIGSLFQKYVYSSFSMKMVLNCVHIWSVDLFLIKD